MLREELGELGPVICKSHLTFLFKMQDIPPSPSPHPHHCLPSLGKHSGFSVRKRLMMGLKTERFLPSLPFPLIDLHLSLSLSVVKTKLLFSPKHSFTTTHISSKDTTISFNIQDTLPLPLMDPF